jgi:hypothetical protein
MTAEATKDKELLAVSKAIANVSIHKHNKGALILHNTKGRTFL